MSSDRKFDTTSGIPLKPSYSSADLKDFDPERDLGLPGEFPFARGIQPEMYRLLVGERGWSLDDVQAWFTRTAAAALLP